LKYYPVFLNLKGRRVLLVGAGVVAQQKVPGLLASQARLHVVAPEAHLDIQGLARDGKIQWSARPYKKADLRGVSLVIAATGDSNLHKQIVKEAHARGLWVNVVDVPSLCDFIAPAVVARGDIQMAISTGGAAPALAKYLRKKFEPLLGREYEEFAKLMKTLRPEILKLPKEKRRSLWECLVSDAFFEEIRKSGIAQATSRLKGWIREP
jgi:precorrin-2 dehydrogenase/sirohydrochlorin ferrochelatase